ncbi:MAG: hypothetical protein HZB25_09330 [Candidatus Eisenbacteria bacterium]|nr:hypothetical protein [Candidatus Eisenbacteria bacterium]
MSPEIPAPDFESKVRFSRLVEECLGEPEMPPAPMLIERVRARIRLEELRRYRRSQVRRAVITGVAAVVALAGVAVGWKLMGDAPARALSTGPASDVLHAYTLVMSAPAQSLAAVSSVGQWTLFALAMAILLYLLRDLFTDPLRGLVSAHRRR